MNGLPRFNEGRALRTVLRWQVLVTAASIILGVISSGRHGAFSAFLGGLVNVLAGAVFALIARFRSEATARAALVRLLCAEAAKVFFVAVALWLVLTRYEGLLLVPFFGAFVLTAVLLGVPFWLAMTNGTEYRWPRS